MQRISPNYKYCKRKININFLLTRVKKGDRTPRSIAFFSNFFCVATKYNKD